jgi:hypothetical protein
LTGMPMSTLLWAGETLHPFPIGRPAELEPAMDSTGKVLRLKGGERNQQMITE